MKQTIHCFSQIGKESSLLFPNGKQRYIAFLKWEKKLIVFLKKEKVLHISFPGWEKPQILMGRPV